MEVKKADEKVKFQTHLLNKCKTEFKKEKDVDRKKSLGNVRFIGELFKLQIISTDIMKYCVSHLLDRPDSEESLERLCILLTTVGEDLEQTPVPIASYFSSLETIVRNRKISNRARFMIQDVIELRDNKWKPRCEDNAALKRWTKLETKWVVIMDGDKIS